jgi:hypothetical protein
MKQTTRPSQFVVCTQGGDDEELIVRKIYEVLPDPVAAKDGYLRVIDESGEDYLYPASYFVPIRLPQTVKQALSAAA